MAQATTKDQMMAKPSGGASRVMLWVGLSVLMVAILFWTMQYMIANGAAAETDDITTVLPDFQMAEVPALTPRIVKPIEKPPEPIDPPLQPQRPEIENMDPDAPVIEVSAEAVDTEVTLSGTGFNANTMGTGDPLPLVKIAPVYPPIAIQRGIEGHCTVIYTVTTIGTTSDLRVDPDDCTNSLFHRASLTAAGKFKYNPQVRNGQTVEKTGVKNRFIYTLGD